MACGYGKDSTQNAEFLNLTPQTYTAPLSTWFPPKTLWLREGPKGGGAVLVLAPYQAHHCLLQHGLHPLAAAARLCCRAALSEMGGGGGEGFGVGGGG